VRDILAMLVVGAALANAILQQDIADWHIGAVGTVLGYFFSRAQNGVTTVRSSRANGG